MKKKPLFDEATYKAYSKVHKICALLPSLLLYDDDPREVTDAAIEMAYEMILAADRPDDRKISKAVMARLKERFSRLLQNQEDEIKAEDAHHKQKSAGKKAVGTAAYAVGRADGYEAGVEACLRRQHMSRPIGGLLLELEYLTLSFVRVEKILDIEPPAIENADMEDFERRIDRIEQALGIKPEFVKETGVKAIAGRLHKAALSDEICRLKAERATRQAKRFIGLSDKAMAEEAARDAPEDLRDKAARAALDAIVYQRNYGMLGEPIYIRRDRIAKAATEAVELVIAAESLY